MEKSKNRVWCFEFRLRLEQIRSMASFQIINVWVTLHSDEKRANKDMFINSDHLHMPQEESNR